MFAYFTRTLVQCRFGRLLVVLNIDAFFNFALALSYAVSVISSDKPALNFLIAAYYAFKTLKVLFKEARQIWSFALALIVAIAMTVSEQKLMHDPYIESPSNVAIVVRVKR